MIAIRKPTESFAELQRQLGDIPAARIRLRPAPGTATAKDVLTIHGKTKRRCELVDGTLVEKHMGLQESFLAIALASHLFGFVRPRKLGIVVGEAGMMEISIGLVRIPDVSFISWKRLPGGVIPEEPIPKLAPDLAVEVLSLSNTLAEMKRKRREYFKAGVSLIWIVDPRARTVTVYLSLRKFFVLTEEDTLDGGDVLPGFKLPLGDLFAELDEKAPE
jgi:Uma2 family endonuclease